MMHIECKAIVGLAVRKDPRVVPAILNALKENSVNSMIFDACAAFPQGEFLPHLMDFSEANPGDREIAAAISACMAAHSPDRST